MFFLMGERHDKTSGAIYEFSHRRKLTIVPRGYLEMVIKTLNRNIIFYANMVLV